MDKNDLILFIDDEDLFAEKYVEQLRTIFTVDVCFNIALAEAILDRRATALKLLVLDIQMPTPPGVATSATENGQSTGLWFLRKVAKKVINGPITVVILTNRGIQEIQKAIDEMGFPENLVIVRSKSDTPRGKLLELAQQQVLFWHG